MPNFSIWISDGVFQEMKVLSKRAKEKGSVMFFDKELTDEEILTRIVFYGLEALKARYAR